MSTAIIIPNETTNLYKSSNGNLASTYSPSYAHINIYNSNSFRRVPMFIFVNKCCFSVGFDYTSYGFNGNILIFYWFSVAGGSFVWAIRSAKGRGKSHRTPPNDWRHLSFYFVVHFVRCSESTMTLVSRAHNRACSIDWGKPICDKNEIKNKSKKKDEEKMRKNMENSYMQIEWIDC